jgi:hypothetical protein
LKPYREIEEEDRSQKRQPVQKKPEFEPKQKEPSQKPPRRTSSKKPQVGDKPAEPRVPKEKQAHPLDEIRVGRFKKFSFYMYLAKKILLGGSPVVKLLGSGDFNIMAIMRLSDLLVESGYASVTQLKPNTFKREGRTICSAMIVLTKAESFQEKYDEFEVKRKERAAANAAAKKEDDESPKNESEGVA